MTVKELKEKLNKCPDDAIITISDSSIFNAANANYDQYSNSVIIY